MLWGIVLFQQYTTCIRTDLSRLMSFNEYANPTETSPIIFPIKLMYILNEINQILPRDVCKEAQLKFKF